MTASVVYVQQCRVYTGQIYVAVNLDLYWFYTCLLIVLHAVGLCYCSLVLVEPSCVLNATVIAACLCALFHLYINVSECLTMIAKYLWRCLAILNTWLFQRASIIPKRT